MINKLFYIYINLEDHIKSIKKKVLSTITEKNNEQVKRRISQREPIRLLEPRIPPQDESDWDEEVRLILRGNKKSSRNYIPNVIKTIVRHPKLFKRWRVFGNHVLFKSSLPDRDREILILRIGWLCQSEYEWGQHVVIGKQAGLNDYEIKRITEGPDAPGWNPFDATLLRAVDELYTDAFISDTTWKKLSERYDTHQLLDLIFTVGQYNAVSMALNTLGVPLDEGIQGFPK